MSEEKGNLELDLKGNIQTKQGEFDTMDNVQIEKIIKNIMYILQDSTQIKSKTQSGALKMISIKGVSSRYEIAVGAEKIKIKKY